MEGDGGGAPNLYPLFLFCPYFFTSTQSTKLKYVFILINMVLIEEYCPFYEITAKKAKEIEEELIIGLMITGNGEFCVAEDVQKEVAQLSKGPSKVPQFLCLAYQIGGLDLFCKYASEFNPHGKLFSNNRLALEAFLAGPQDNYLDFEAITRFPGDFELNRQKVNYFDNMWAEEGDGRPSPHGNLVYMARNDRVLWGLLKLGAKINNIYEGKTALSMAISASLRGDAPKCSQNAQIKMLLEYGADINLAMPDIDALNIVPAQEDVEFLVQNGLERHNKGIFDNGDFVMLHDTAFGRALAACTKSQAD